MSPLCFIELLLLPYTDTLQTRPTLSMVTLRLTLCTCVNSHKEINAN